MSIHFIFREPIFIENCAVQFSLAWRFKSIVLDCYLDDLMLCCGYSPVLNGVGSVAVGDRGC